MLFKYHIQHEGQPEHVGYAVAEIAEEAIILAKTRFAGWGVGSSAGAVMVKDKKVKRPEPELFDLGWINPIFKGI